MSNVLYFLEERIPNPLRQLVLSYLDSKKFNHRLCFYSQSTDSIVENLEWAEVILFAPGRYLDDELMSKASHIKLMQLWSSGYDKFNLAGAKKYNILVSNNGGANAISVAEHTLLLMLATARKLPESHLRATKGLWAGNAHGMDMVMLYKKTLSIIGMGNIGKQVAQRAKAFGMSVLYYDIKRLDTAIERDLGVGYCNMDELLERADFLSLH